MMRRRRRRGRLVGFLPPLQQRSKLLYPSGIFLLASTQQAAWLPQADRRQEVAGADATGLFLLPFGRHWPLAIGLQRHRLLCVASALSRCWRPH